MNSPTTFNGTKTLKEIREKEALAKELTEKLSSVNFDLQELRKLNAANITIQWKESINVCVELDADNPGYFLKTPAFISNCVAWNHGVEVTRDIKNKVATNLSQMFNQKLIGRIDHNGKTYYGDKKFFKPNKEKLTVLNKEYVSWIEDLIQ